MLLPKTGSLAARSVVTSRALVVEAEPLRETLNERVFRYIRTVIVGSLATIADLGVLVLCTRTLGLDPVMARIPALMAGGLVQFFGGRSFAFRAQAGAVSGQATRFLVHELVGLPLTLLTFRLMVGVLTFLPPEIVSLVVNFILFVTYYYPVRRFIVFHVPAPRPA